MNRIIPRKRFGQHFLVDPIVLEQLISVFSPQKQDLVLEIGAGSGVLTTRLLKELDHLVAVELDRDLANLLSVKFTRETLTVIPQDILNLDLRTLKISGLDRKIRIIGNLPYNISTPLIFHLLKFTDIIQDMLFMVQKEVALRLGARPGDRNYGRLSVMSALQLHCDYLFDVAPSSFNPPPKVDSGVIHLYPRPASYQISDPVRLENLVRQAFSQRRKTLRNSLSNLVTDRQFEVTGITASNRAENLDVTDYIRLANIQ